MAKLIFSSRYIRDAPPEHLQNYVRYISTREGVEKADESKKNLPATSAQKDLIRKLKKDMPESKDMLEYEDYHQQPTIGNASEFITQALERNLDMVAMKENYVNYLANRPRVERIGEHGLFTDAGRPVILAEVQKEVSSHKGPVWTHVVSLRREDAARFGYDSAREWMALLRSKRAMLSRHMKIDSADLRWYAAFHNEGHHPHVHLMVYSAKDNDGFLTKAGIEAMRSELTHDIFRQDFAQIYEGQNLARSSLKEKAAERMCLFADSMLQGVCENPIIGEKLKQLSARLKNTGGKKVYGYLKADMKRLVDQIVDELAKDPVVLEAYRAWGEWQDQILLTYSSKLLPLPPLSSQKQLKSIKNMVIAEALKLGGHHFLSETSGQERIEAEIRLNELEEEAIPDGSEEIEETEIEIEAEPADVGSMLEPEEFLSEQDVPDSSEGEKKKSIKAEWSQQYKLARSYLYGNEKIPQDYSEAMRLLCQEAEQGNAFAMYELGRMWADGLGVEADSDIAEEWYRKALDTFLSVEKEMSKRNKTYLQYQIGKMYLVGLGTEKDYETAVVWLERAAEENHNCAQHTLGCLYLKGKEIPKDVEKAVALLRQSALQGNGYAQYRLGNVYLLGEDVSQNLKEAVKWLELSADQGNQFAQYALGKLFLCDQSGMPRDREKADSLLEAAAAQGNVYARFLLENLDPFQNPDLVLAATRLMHHLSRLFQEDYRKASGGSGMGHIDRRRKRKLLKKQMAQGHKKDDHEPQQSM